MILLSWGSYHKTAIENLFFHLNPIYGIIVKISEYNGRMDYFENAKN
jgi:hypothetical protein